MILIHDDRFRSALVNTEMCLQSEYTSNALGPELLTHTTRTDQFPELDLQHHLHTSHELYHRAGQAISIVEGMFLRLGRIINQTTAVVLLQTVLIIS